MRMICLYPALASAASPEPYTELARLFGLPGSPTPDQLTICYGYGCVATAEARLSPQQWQHLRSLFAQPAHTAADERDRIATAIGWLETWVGKQTGTDGDLGRNPMAANFSDLPQLDCVDESVNTSTYLTLLQNAGLLRWHRLTERASRGVPPFAWPHNTAVVIARDGSAWAVDSWFDHNGHPARIVALDHWLAGWQP